MREPALRTLAYRIERAISEEGKDAMAIGERVLERERTIGLADGPGDGEDD
jgi:hypothetical protein